MSVFIKRVMVATSLAIALPGTAYAQIPVTDVASVTKRAAEHAAAIAKYVEQITELQAQLSQLKQTYNSLNGLRNVGDLLNNELLVQYLPTNYQAALADLQAGTGGEFASISGTLTNIVKTNQLKTCTESALSVSARKACEIQWQTLALNKQVGDMGYQQAAKNITNLQVFTNAIKSSPDPKSLQDLQARIQVEQVRMQNEQVKLTTIAMMEEAARRMQQQAATDNFKTGLSKGSAGGFRY